jgi:hypothetical protein
VSVEKAALDKFLATTRSGVTVPSKSVYLILALRIKNISETKKLRYRSWGGLDAPAAVLKDSFGNTYARFPSTRELAVKGHLASARIDPGESVVDVLVFERPIDRADAVFLTLPMTAFEGEAEGEIIFRIPRGARAAPTDGKTREQQIRESEEEIGRIKDSIKGDEDRLAKAKTPRERQKYQGLIDDYKKRLADEEKRLAGLKRGD